MKRFLLLLFVLPFLSCRSDAEIAASYHWKWVEGFRLGDRIEFNDRTSDSGFYIINDTLYDSRMPVALVTDLTYYFDHYRMEITSIDRKEKGIYTEKGNAKPAE